MLASIGFTYSVIESRKGDNYVSISRGVHIEREYSWMVTKANDRIHYVFLCKNHIDNIVIELKTDHNKVIPFRYVKTIIKLHFRPAKQ